MELSSDEVFELKKFDKQRTSKNGINLIKSNDKKSGVKVLIV